MFFQKKNSNLQHVECQKNFNTFLWATHLFDDKLSYSLKKLNILNTYQIKNISHIFTILAHLFKKFNRDYIYFPVLEHKYMGIYDVNFVQAIYNIFRFMQ